MQWIFGALGGIGFVELMIRLPVFPTLSKVNTTIARAVEVVVSDKISDHWKEKILPRYALRLFKLTIRLGVYLSSAFLPFFALYAIAIALKHPFWEFTMSWKGIGFITVIAAMYARVRSACVQAKL